MAEFRFVAASARPYGAPMGRRIMVVFDGSPAGYEDLDEAVAIAEAGGGTLEIAATANINRWTLALGLGGGYDTIGLEDEILADLDRKLTEAIAAIPRRIEVRSQIVHGSASRFLRRARASINYDVVVYRGVRRAPLPA